MSGASMFEGTTVTLDDGPDPRLGYQAPFARQIVTKSGGLTQTVTRTRTATCAPNDITNVTALVDQMSVNGSAAWTSAYQKLANGTATWIRTSPLGRQGTMTLDASGRAVLMSVPGIAPVSLEYVTAGPNKGQISKISQASGGETRATEFAYDVTGNVTQVTSLLGETTHYAHDANGRIIQATSSDGRSPSSTTPTATSPRWCRSRRAGITTSP
jgi:YD repeat-containing protein